MRIVVLDGHTLNPGDNPWTAVESLGDLTVYPRTQTTEIVQRAQGADVVLSNKVPLDKTTLDQLPELKFISVLATGFNIIDISAAQNAGIIVSNVPVYSTDSVAQWVFAALLSHLHRPMEHDAAIRSGHWKSCGDFSFSLLPLVELARMTMGIVGFGRIGRRVGELADAFGMKVIAYNPSRKPDPDFKSFRWVERDEVFEASDFVSLNCPQTKENTEFVDAKLLGKMKPTSVLINASRGGLINEADLASALNGNQIAAALLDVVSQEPIVDDNPLLSAKNCLLTPHVAWATVAARRRMMATTAENIAAFQSGKPINVVS